MEDNKNVEEKEVKSEQTKKKNSVLSIILIIILMAICLVAGYFINDAKIFNSFNVKEEKKVKKDKKEEKEPVVTNYEVTDGRVVNLIDTLLRVGLYNARCRIVEFYANDKKVTTNDIENLMAYHIAEADASHNQDSFSLDDMNNAIHKILGKDYQFNPTSINYQGQSCLNYNYEKETKMFVKQYTACGGTCGPTSSYKMVKAVDTDGVLKIYTKVIFASLGDGKDADGIYSDYAKTNKIGTYDDDSEALYDKGSDYQFTFKLEDGNYVFVSSEPVK